MPSYLPGIVRQIDHVLIASNDPKQLFSLLTDTFQLPVVWPLSNYGSFASGGVAAGNVNLEILEVARESRTEGESARLVGFALEPEPLQNSLPQLAARGIQHGTPSPYRSSTPSGSTMTLWTTVGLPDVSNDTSNIFLCAYEHDVPAQRRHSSEQLRSRNGGPLSIESAREIEYGTTDIERMQQHWQKLLDPQHTKDGAWTLAGGPAIRLVQANQDSIQSLVLKVRSLQQARDFLQEHGLLASEQPGALRLAGPPLQGLNITLVE